MKIAIAQLPSIGMGSGRLDYFIRAAINQHVRLVVLPEYALFPFFKALRQMSVALVAEYAVHQKKMIVDLAKRYDITIIAPIVIKKGKTFYKAVMRANAKSVHYYHQQFLIDYAHWNEKEYFQNDIVAQPQPMVFSLDGFKIGVMNGFESHFDLMWQQVQSKHIDAMVIPSCATFGSIERWHNLMKMRAFTHNCYVIWANRIGVHEESSDNLSHNWRFYGHSMVADASGQVMQTLKDEEAVLIAELTKSHLKEERRAWGFKHAMKPYL